VALLALHQNDDNPAVCLLAGFADVQTNSFGEMAAWLNQMK